MSEETVQRRLSEYVERVREAAEAKRAEQAAVEDEGQHEEQLPGLTFIGAKDFALPKDEFDALLGRVQAEYARIFGVGGDVEADILRDLTWQDASEDGTTTIRAQVPREIWRGLYDVGTPPSDDGYDSLRTVLARAVEQAQGGKGKERHANGQPFERQPICEGGRRFGAGCLIYQAWKKAHEVPVLLKMDNPKERAVRELLGVINYAAAAIIVIEEG